MKKINADFKKGRPSNGKRLAIKMITVGFSVLALFVTFIYLQNANSAALDTINIVRLKADLPAGAAIGLEDVEKYAIIRKEYD